MDELTDLALAAVDEARAKCAHLDPRLRECPRGVSEVQPKGLRTAGPAQFLRCQVWKPN